MVAVTAQSVKTQHAKAPLIKKKLIDASENLKQQSLCRPDSVLGWILKYPSISVAAPHVVLMDPDQGGLKTQIRNRNTAFNGQQKLNNFYLLFREKKEIK